MEFFLNYPLDNALSRIVAEKILEQILNGDLKPGDKIVESVYAEMFDTSRSPIREAIYMLTTEGLIERIPRKGAFVKGYTLSEIQDLLDIRNNIELLSAKRIHEPHKKKDLLEELKSILKELEKCTNQVQYVRLNYAFHYTIIKFSESSVLEGVYSKISFPLLRIQGIHFSQVETIEKSKEEHRKIYEHLKRNEMGEFTELLRHHTQNVIFNVSKTLF
ncbi:GntR family transcriptional regulator [Ureibacillus sinduriensis]|uniref:GntR family transcriptional regulator n=1 Tax=Ureibacillus sinduriensis BLB-1 = JCM 15800 TaxID=1384057 RepID=A0A0A3I0U7_9BACL|nr:GntR family transcriptional regulator [Ureibacillus sinduriensis]KGR76258.1 GntR family transcriptional regulator [Ureibacillus sinduriensis BLB-1 = JCM 15800]